MTSAPVAASLIRCVVPVSGGKDSQACLQLACAEFGADSVLGLFCDTQFEHPKTYAHIDFIRSLYGVRIETVCAGSVDDKCLKYGRFPSGVARFCTDELKMRPSRDFYAAFALTNGPFEVWYGMRSNESPERAKRYASVIESDLYQPHELFPVKYPKKLGAAGVRFRLPVLNWTSCEVKALIFPNANPLYAEGFDRVGCFPCLASGPNVKAKAFGHDAFGHSQSERVISIAAVIGKDAMSGDGQTCGVCLI
jgi:3'-phosphoadenosine 5'-phosphosulfate sulfotransferase (PAPS reductase)/FAD synthetase